MAGRVVTPALRSVIPATSRQKPAEAQVATRIRATGGAAGYAADDLRRIASGLQDVPGVIRRTYDDQTVGALASLTFATTLERPKGNLVGVPGVCCAAPTSEGRRCRLTTRRASRMPRDRVSW